MDNEKTAALQSWETTKGMGKICAHRGYKCKEKAIGRAYGKKRYYGQEGSIRLCAWHLDFAEDVAPCSDDECDCSGRLFISKVHTVKRFPPCDKCARRIDACTCE